MNTPAGKNRVGELVGGKYRLARIVAAGGMGVVYEAQQIVVKRRVAVKFLHAAFTDRRDILERFRLEAETAGALDSEHIAAALDFGVAEDGTPYIVMEYLAGESLGSLMRREGKLPLARAADLCEQACAGIAAAHAAGIVHRDLKPENLFVVHRGDGTDLIKLLDFGIARLEDYETGHMTTRTGGVLGTPAYMSPEQARGDGGVDRRADIYALAAILFEMLSGKKAHPGDSPNAVLHHIATQPVVASLHLDPAAIPKAVADAVTRALDPDPKARTSSALELAHELRPFAERRSWPPPPSPPAPASAPESARPSANQPEARDVHAPAAPHRRTVPRWVVLTVAAAAMAVLLGVTIAARRHAAPSRPLVQNQALPHTARFFVANPNSGAVQQIAALVKQGSFAEAAALTAMSATPQAVWFTGGTVEDVRSAVQHVVVRATAADRVPVLVAHNIPFRDCAQYSAGGASSAAAYHAWIDGFAEGIGHARAVVILEPDSLGIIPYNTTLEGVPEWCKPTTNDAQGATVPAPGATAEERFRQVRYAVDSLAARAKHALVYLDGTHAGWLAVGDIAFRLVKAGVAHTQGFFVNVANFHATEHSVQYGTWISKCIHYASRTAQESAGGALSGRRYRDCASQYSPADPLDFRTWERSNRWYVEHVDRTAAPPQSTDLLHFLVDTSRNGQGPLDVARYGRPPYNQGADVLARLTTGNWCNPPGAGLGSPPTADTGLALVDAFLWVKPPGVSDGSCDAAGGVRAWDYRRYNPWGIAGDAQAHFDPLWGNVDPAPGEWFPAQALELAQKASPPLEVSRR